MKKRMVIIAPLPAIRKRTRLTKIARYFGERGYSIAFWGWERLPGEAEPAQAGASDRILLRGGGYSASAARARYPLWGLRVLQHALKLPADTVVWALGLETALPAVLAARVKGFKVIFDDADRFLLLRTFPRPLYKVVRALEVQASERSLMHIIPGEERYDYSSSKFFVLKNMPSKVEVDGLPLPENWDSGGDLCVYVNGWLGDGRGMGPVLDAARRLEGEPIRFIAAGRVDCDAAREFVALPNVTYLGELPNRTALAWYQVADFVFTYYDPKVPINRYAEANKWGDAMVLGVPVLVNREVETARFLMAAGAAAAHAYEDTAGLAEFLRGVAHDRGRLAAMREAVQTLADRHGYFEDGLGRIRERIEKEQ